MNPTNERHDDSSGLQSRPISSGLIDELDEVTAAFHEFLFSNANAASQQGDAQGKSFSVATIVEEFSRRLTFLAELQPDELYDIKLHDRLLQLTDAEMSEMAIAAVGSESSKQRLTEYLSRLPFPHYEPVAGNIDLVVRIDEDGTRTAGRFVNQEFVASKND